MAGLLDQLSPDQQSLVYPIAEAYLADDGHWPIFDYLEATFDAQHKDAWDTLYGLPRTFSRRTGSRSTAGCSGAHGGG